MVVPLRRRRPSAVDRASVSGTSFHHVAWNAFQMCQDGCMATKTRHTERREEALSRERIVDAADRDARRRGRGRVDLPRACRAPDDRARCDLLARGEQERTAQSPPPTPSSPTRWPPMSPMTRRRKRSERSRSACSTRSTRTPGSARSSPALRRSRRCCGSSNASVARSRRSAFPSPPSSPSASALLNYILGVGGQNAANARAPEPGTNRTEFLETVSAAWAEPRSRRVPVHLDDV